MKLRNQILAFLFVSASFTAAAGAAPAEPAENPPTDVFGISVIAQGGDCDQAPVRAAAHEDQPNGTDPWSTCGKCGPDICDGRPVGAICGGLGDNGRIMNCQDYLGMLCPIQDGIRCRCSSDDIP